MSRKRRHLKPKQRILFFVEGETEEAFFNTLAQEYRLTASQTTQIMSNSGIGWVEKAKSYMLKQPSLKPDSNTKVFLIFDKNNDSNNKISDMIRAAENLKINGSVCQVGFSNDSFEVWLLAHYQKMSSSIMSSQKLYAALSKRLNEKYVKAKQNQIKLILADDKVYDAIENTKSISEISLEKQSTNIGTIVSSVIQSKR